MPTLTSIKELDFVVRSTGVVAEMESPDQVGDFVIALANGCLIAGVPPRKMTPPMSKENQPAKLQPFSFADKVVFVGAVAGVIPPVGSTGVEMVANEMEGELAMAGIKEGAKWTPVDFRNPCVSVDFGTTLDGRITSDVSQGCRKPVCKDRRKFLRACRCDPGCNRPRDGPCPGTDRHCTGYLRRAQRIRGIFFRGEPQGR